MKTASPRNALAFLGDKLQARRDAAFLDEYRKQEHASLQQEGLYNVEADAEILAKQQKVTSVIKYNHQSPGNRTSFSTSAQVLYYSPVNPSAEHGRSSNSPRRRQIDMFSQVDMAKADATLSPKTLRRSRLGVTITADRTLGASCLSPSSPDRAIDRALSMSATQRFHAAMTPAADRSNLGTDDSQQGSADADLMALSGGASVTSRGQRGKHLSELLQPPGPATPRRHGAVTVRFSDESPAEQTSCSSPKQLSKTLSYQKCDGPLAHRAASISWDGNCLTSPNTITGSSPDSSARSDVHVGVAHGQHNVQEDAPADESSRSGSCSGSDSDSESEACSEANSSAGSSEVGGTAGTALSAGLSSSVNTAANAALYFSSQSSLNALAADTRHRPQHEAQQAQQAPESTTDRCLMPLSRLQQPDFMPAGAKRNSDSRLSSQVMNHISAGSRTSSDTRQFQTGLIWQNSGWTVPFDAALVRRTCPSATSETAGEEQPELTTSLSWHATCLDEMDSTVAMPGTADVANSNQVAGAVGPARLADAALSKQVVSTEGSAGVPGLHETAGRAEGTISNDAMLSQPDAASVFIAAQPHQLPTSAILPLSQPDAEEVTTYNGIQREQQVEVEAGEAMSSTEARQQSTAAKHAKHGRISRSGVRHKKHGRHDKETAMAHVEDHLQILKHVHLKKASPRYLIAGRVTCNAQSVLGETVLCKVPSTTLVQNRARAEQLGFAALPETLEGWQPAAAPTALRPVTGQDTWYRLGLHVLPEELNAAVLEALAAEAAGLPTPSAQTGPPQPNTSPSASWLMRMEASVKVMVYDEKLDGPAAGKQRIPAINPNRAYLKSLAQGSAKKHFQSVEVDLRESHRRLLATQAALQPVKYGSRFGSVDA